MLTRKMLKTMGIEEEKIDQIIEAHTETTDALKADRDKYREEADKLSGLQKELTAANDKLNDAKEQLKASNEKVEQLNKEVEAGNSYKEKYETEHNAFEEYKKEVDANNLYAKKTEAYKNLLKKAEVQDKRFDAILKVTKMDDFELDDKGQIKDADKVVEDIKNEWSEFIVVKSTKGAGSETPPSNTGGGAMTKEEILGIKDRAERQKAISENHELFGY